MSLLRIKPELGRVKSPVAERNLSSSKGLAKATAKMKIICRIAIFFIFIIGIIN